MCKAVLATFLIFSSGIIFAAEKTKVEFIVHTGTIAEMTKLTGLPLEWVDKIPEPAEALGDLMTITMLSLPMQVVNKTANDGCMVIEAVGKGFLLIMANKDGERLAYHIFDYARSLGK